MKDREQFRNALIHETLHSKDILYSTLARSLDLVSSWLRILSEKLRSWIFEDAKQPYKFDILPF